MCCIPKMVLKFCTAADGDHVTLVPIRSVVRKMSGTGDITEHGPPESVQKVSEAGQVAIARPYGLIDHTTTRHELH